MNKIAIFYHVYQAGDWVNVFQEQIMRMMNSGLFDAAEFVHIGVNGDQPIQQFSDKVKVVYNPKNQHHDESPTLKSLWDFCYINKDYKVLYIHTSGVRFSIDIKSSLYFHKTLWRKYQEYFVVDRWEHCISLLDFYDCAGVEWKNDCVVNGDNRSDLSHYSGNIWWSKSEYISKLDPWYLFNNVEHGRNASEFFIGTGRPNYYNFYSSNKNLYFEPIYEHEYKN